MLVATKMVAATYISGAGVVTNELFNFKSLAPRFSGVLPVGCPFVLRGDLPFLRARFESKGQRWKCGIG